MTSTTEDSSQVAAAAAPATGNVQEVKADPILYHKAVVSARTLARRLRIERRALIEKRKKEAAARRDYEDDQRSLLERQLSGSNSVLTQLIEDGKELINNVNVGNNVRELRRKGDHSEAHDKRMKALEEEARLAEEKFKEINSKWQVIESYNDPLDINSASQIQRNKCAELITQKNTIIAMLKKELEYEDFRFTSDQEVQLNDVSILVDRIDNQINIMRRAYKNQLIFIENAIDIERIELMENNRKLWEELNKENEEGEVSYIDTRQEKIEDHETSMIITTIEYEEKCRQLKISLENDIQIMQQKLEELKAKCLLNSEKLNYDYHILRKRDEENIAIKAQQKRKINKLQEEITMLYQTLKDLTFTSREEIAKINGELNALRANISSINKKMSHFFLMNNKQYLDLWKFNVKEAKGLISEILLIDKSMHEQQLNCPWNPPEIDLHLDEISFLSEKLMGFQQCDGADIGSCQSNYTSTLNTQHEKIAKLILQKICDQTGFLLDKNIKNLLSSYPPDKRALIKLETVFTLLGIKSEEDVKLLKTYFMPYAICLECSEKSSLNVTKGKSQDRLLSRSSSYPNLCVCTDEEKWKQLHPLQRNSVSESYLSLVSHSSDQKKTVLLPAKTKSKIACCNESHTFNLETTDVLKGLNIFIQNIHQNDKSLMKNYDHGFVSCNPPSINDFSITQESAEKYWEKLRHVFVEDREKLWNGLTVGLNKYFKVLKERQKVRTEIEILLKENNELKILLGRHLNPLKVKSAPSKSCFPPLNGTTRKDLMSINSRVKFEKTVI